MERILFVCLANICRSPAGEGVLRHMAAEMGLSDQVDTESCGIGDWSLGAPPDERMTRAAAERGIALSGKARIFQPNFFDAFDYILTVDHEVKRFLLEHAKTPEHKAKLYLITDFSTHYKGKDVPDPYYQGRAMFDLVLDILEDSCRGLLEQIADKADAESD